MTRITHESHFSWQADYLVMLESNPCCSRNVNDISCVGTVKHGCRSSIVYCIAEVPRRNVVDVSCVATIKRISAG